MTNKTENDFAIQHSTSIDDIERGNYQQVPQKASTESHQSNQTNQGHIFQKFKDLQSSLGNGKRTSKSSRNQGDNPGSHKRVFSKSNDSNSVNDTGNTISGSSTGTFETSTIAIIEPMSKFRISERIMKALEVKKRLMAQSFVPIQSVEQHVAKLQQSTAAYFSTLLEQPNEKIQIDPSQSKNWATVGILADDPQERTSAKQTKYSLLKISNLVDVHLNVLLFGKTHQAWAPRLRRGMIIGIQQPKILRPTETDTTTGLHIDQVNHIFIIGWSKDCAQCEAYLRNGSQCSAIIDGRNGIYCEDHIRNAFKRSKNSRMELASGNITMAICSATEAQDNQGRHVYKVKDGIPAQARNTNDNRNRAASDNSAYILDGRGIVTNGKTINSLLAANNSKGNKKKLAEFLSSRNDIGAQMLRRAIGLGVEPATTTDSDKKAPSPFSSEAVRKIGFNPDASAGLLSRSEKDEKCRAINRLLHREKDTPAPSVSQLALGSQSEDKYVYL
ncbi:hypothetical protein BGW37DRAFT_505850 [Umbelopsis sp. PMI_123]|nr:hypothetical protein BGW37DRAFT_505850 [Umbelopsis sp. PMI_123]